ncbi:MAG: lipid A export permease/ATP-binding protein MsbA [Gammaproteobacteria bacterium]|nr:lipid A export permease/ATP-binding protein MsbA [Gammaproteobacteria bacterium]MDD9957786.1 lipid A export permease/ATP-binding protein MsbA [Gammaproteobacteria bacterium]
MAKSKSSDPQYQGWQLYRRLFTYVKVYQLAIIGSILGYIIFAATTPATTWWLGLTVDAISSENYEELRILSPLLCVLIVIVRGVGGFMGSYSLASIANHVIHKLRCELIDHLISLPAAFFDKTTSGKLVSKFTYDVTQITGAASNAVAVIVREGFTVLGLLIYLMIIDWQLSLTFLVIAPFVAGIVNLASKRFRRYSTQMQDSMGDVTQITNESIKGHRVIRTFNAEDFVSERLMQASEKNRRQNMKMAMTRSASTPLVQLIVSMALALLVWLAMSPDFFSDKTPGDFVAFLGAAGLLAKPIRQLTQINSVIQRGLSAAYSIFTLLDEKSEVDEGSHVVQRVRGEIEFDRVSFSYNESAKALDEISFSAKPGQTIALVGKSGSGKSSLVSLIPRFYDIDAGLISLDAIPLKDYKLTNLRDQISVVTQQVVLFNGTVAENIAYGEKELDLEKITMAAENAHAMEFINELADGLNTPVGDDASLLSGGQRQRIAIARALLKDAPILIFDEATSALDSESEQHIQAALETLIKGRTTFVIAHRLSTIENADLILVMDQGKIVESGVHNQLLNQDGHYARLHKIQFTENDAASLE